MLRTAQGCGPRGSAGRDQDRLDRYGLRRQTWTMPLSRASGLISWLHAGAGISEGEAYALCSMAVNFRVTQYSHQTGSAYTSIPPKAVHGMVPKHIFLRPCGADGTLAPSKVKSSSCAHRSRPVGHPRASPGPTTPRPCRDADAYVCYFTDDAVLDGEKGSAEVKTNFGILWARSGSPKGR